MGQRVVRHQRRDVPQLGLLRLQKLAPRRRVVEKVAHRDGRSHRQPRVLHANDLSARNLHRRSRVVLRRARLQRQPRDAGNRRQRLAAKAQCADRQQVVGAVQLRRGVPLEGQQRVVAHHALSIVHNADQLASAALHLDAHPRRARVQRVLQQLLDHRRRPLHHLAGRNLVGHLVGEYPYASHPPIVLLPDERRLSDGHGFTALQAAEKLPFLSFGGSSGLQPTE